MSGLLCFFFKQIVSDQFSQFHSWDVVTEKVLYNSFLVLPL